MEEMFSQLSEAPSSDELERRGRYLTLEFPVCPRCGHRNFLVSLQITYHLEGERISSREPLRGRVYCAWCRKALPHDRAYLVLGLLFSNTTLPIPRRSDGDDT